MTTTVSNPEGMMPIAEFASKKGISTDEIISMIRSGFYEGKKVENDWFVKPKYGSPSEIQETDATSDRVTDYGIAKGVSKFISILGWITVVIGCVVTFTILGDAPTNKWSGERIFSFVALLPGIGLSVTGVFLVAAAQVARATVDNADHTRQILELLKTKS